MPPHFVMTRLGVGVHSPEWFARTLDLLDAITVPSLRQQTQQNFVWLLVVDADLPSAARTRLDDILRRTPQCHVVSVDIAALRRVRLGCFDWIWEHCQNVILQQGWIADSCSYVTTSIIDADDAWHRDVVQVVQQHVAQHALRDDAPPDEGRGTWLGHSRGLVLNLPRGYKWFVTTNAIERQWSPFMPMAISVTARFSSGISVCSSRHLGWPQYAAALDLRVESIERRRPMWLYARHPDNVQPWDGRRGRPVDARGQSRLHDDFGVDFERLRAWQQRYGAAPARHTGCSITEQYDRLYRIASLNLEIDALQSTRTPNGAADRAARLARAEAARATVLAAFRADGAS